MRDSEGGLVVDRRVFTFRVGAADANGEPTLAPLALLATLTYEDGTPLPPEVQPIALGHNATFRGKHDGFFKLKVNILSKLYGGRKFRVRISPQDLSEAKAQPGLTLQTEAFRVIGHTTPGEVYQLKLPPPPKPERVPAPPKPERTANGGVGSMRSGGGSNGGPRPTIFKAHHQMHQTNMGASTELDAASSNMAIAAAALFRRRYFPADAIRAATDAPPADVAAAQPGGVPELSRSGIAACDRLAAMVTQQLTQRAWQHARKQRGGHGCQLAASDVAAVARQGMFDFLHEAGVTTEWLVDEPEAAPSPRQLTAPLLSHTAAPSPLAPQPAPPDSAQQQEERDKPTPPQYDSNDPTPPKHEETMPNESMESEAAAREAACESGPTEDTSMTLA